jgi:thiazole synthase
MIIENSNVPVVVDAGIGSPSHAAYAMEMGADAVLVNTCIATAKNPVLMAEAIKEAVIAGRKGFLSGIPSQSFYGSASSPLKGMIF